ncbi:hypothetical protein [Paenibacillus dakarensis]|uniref:hypothetical protein n=1 Tax=Paenibacillus dakarensis TaxID=1527293 RepID=UPI0006D5932E|nr:hypothetical protein [Paenibacillus dakarensis]
MVAHLLWILGIYGVAVALVHILNARRHRRPSSRRYPVIHYVLITSNHERQVEWYLRALSLYALLSGTRLRVTVLDDQSYDQTVQIAHRMAGLSAIDLNVYDWTPDVESTIGQTDSVHDEEEKRIKIDLRISSEAFRIPYVQG